MDPEKQIIGAYSYFNSPYMGKPAVPFKYEMKEGLYDKWVDANQSGYSKALAELKLKITHVSFQQFRAALELTVNKFKSTILLKEAFQFVSFVQPGRVRLLLVGKIMQPNFPAHHTIPLIDFVCKIPSIFPNLYCNVYNAN